MKNLKLRTDYSDEERLVDYEKNVQWAQKLIDEVDEIRFMCTYRQRMTLR